MYKTIDKLLALQYSSIMKKIVLVIVSLVLLAGIAAAAYKTYHHFTKQEPSMAKSPATNSIFGSIQEALSKDLTLQCNFTDQSGKQTTSYIKHGQVRADIVSSDPKQSGSVVVKDKKVYFWNSTIGMMMNLPDEAETAGMVKQATGVTPGATNEGGDMLAALEKYKDHCKPAVVDDSLFTPPANVKFQDLSKMMPSGAPTGMMPSVMTQYQQH